MIDVQQLRGIVNGKLTDEVSIAHVMRALEPLLDVYEAACEARDKAAEFLSVKRGPWTDDGFLAEANAENIWLDATEHVDRAIDRARR